MSEIPIIVVTQGSEATSAQNTASDLVAEVLPLAWSVNGWSAVAGMSSTLLFRSLAHQEGFTTADLIAGLGSALANTFDMSARDLRLFLQQVEEEAAYQFAAKASNLSIMPTDGEA